MARDGAFEKEKPLIRLDALATHIARPRNRHPRWKSNCHQPTISTSMAILSSDLMAFEVGSITAIWMEHLSSQPFDYLAMMMFITHLLLQPCETLSEMTNSRYNCIMFFDLICLDLTTLPTIAKNQETNVRANRWKRPFATGKNGEQVLDSIVDWRWIFRGGKNVAMVHMTVNGRPQYLQSSTQTHTHRASV